MRSVLHLTKLGLIRPSILRRSPRDKPPSEQKPSKGCVSWAWAAGALTVVVAAGCAQFNEDEAQEQAELGSVVAHGPATFPGVSDFESTDMIHFDDVKIEVEPASQKNVDAETVATTKIGAVDLFAQEALFHAKGDDDYTAQGKEHQANGRVAEAITSFRHSVYDEDNAEKWTLLGTALFENDERDRGAKAFEHALTKDKNTHNARFKLVRYYLQKGKFASARGHAEELSRRQNSDVPSRYLLGLTYIKTEMWQEAMQAFTFVVKEEPENAHARNNLGFAALQIGKYDDALSALELLIGHPDVRASMLNNLGVAYEKSGRTAEAIAAFQRSVELNAKYVNGIVNEKRLHDAADDEILKVAAATLQEMRKPIVKSAVASRSPHAERSTEAADLEATPPNLE
ncbi:MAG: tetratricopeptide repeat protein [Deltaproteobacteria bacterium]|nr:tetratricopeptide repeat protein [Deltaproteobacteria bacterium]